MRWLRLTLAYDGTNYCGWQVQPNGVSVQAVVESAWHRVTGEQLRVTASGRTDAGVHALGQVAGVATATRHSCDVLLRACNAWLPEDVRVRQVHEAPRNFHAIRDARSKIYRYVIQDGGVSDPFQRRYCWYLPQQLELTAMQDAAEFLRGRHDFASFQASGSERKSTVRTVHRLTLERKPTSLASTIVLEIEADGFLYNMVRNIVGSLVQIGQGRYPIEWLADVLAARDRKRAGVTAPPQGLFLVAVHY